MYFFLFFPEARCFWVPQEGSNIPAVARRAKGMVFEHFEQFMISSGTWGSSNSVEPVHCNKIQ